MSVVAVDFSAGLAAAASRGAGEVPRIYLTPGSLFCGTEPAVVSTVLGSCVAVCLIDRHRRAAGMNHFVLPSSRDGENSLRYGDVAIERLRERMAWLGCEGADLRAKVFGGAAVLPFGEASETVGDKNVRIAIAWLRRHDIPVVARRTGGTTGLLLRMETGSGQVLVRDIPRGSEPSGFMPRHDSNRGFSLAAGA